MPFGKLLKIQRSTRGYSVGFALGRARFTSVCTTQNIGQTPVKFIEGVILLEIFGMLMKFFFLSFTELAHTRRRDGKPQRIR